MRLFIIPISTRRALIYARPLRREHAKDLSILDRITNKAAETWAKWEEADKGWKKHLVLWGNRVQQRIPYEEWGLKSIPSLNAQRRLDESYGSKKIDVLFPGNAIKTEKLQSMLYKIATDRQDLHRKRMWWSFIACPITAPIGLIPLVPNIPFFYLAYRGWSHWRALNGSKHLEYLVEKGLLNPISLPALERLYAKRVSRALKKSDVEQPASSMVEDVEKSDDRLLLRMDDAKKLASMLEAPELALEAERAIIQVEEKLQQDGASRDQDVKKDSHKEKDL
ncbi:mitochondrial K+-H+ exchange-related-domain-containing protein [Aspergillus avenaceus]|uniref:Mitochondrial K+-H+ exchange-related-domain-containing protein n=1 Tax=Aspergillus avenaceus TaxID=36643 RepID=A0A5N6TNB0_ASPAV|nr:mitochondrial K+-H+ exchange-related-domain-containing protein [Aspergillus avenaceus]